jgi:hypothetical protein
MSSVPERPVAQQRRGLIRGPQSLVGGLALIAVARLALYLSSDLSQGTLRAIGPGMLPRWLAMAVGFCGVVLVALAFIKDGDRIEPSTWRGPVFVALGIMAFALTIRPVAIDLAFGPLHIGPFTTPGLGMIIAGPLGMIIGGYATPEARLRDLVILGFGLTAFCMVLFGDLLNLPIPIFPQSLAQLFPADWSQKAILRATAALMALAAALVFFATHRDRTAPVDMPDHSGRI